MMKPLDTFHWYEAQPRLNPTPAPKREVKVLEPPFSPEDAEFLKKLRISPDSKE